MPPNFRLEQFAKYDIRYGLHLKQKFLIDLQHFDVCIENAAQVKWSLGIARGKNDKVDSRRLALYAVRHADRLKPTPALHSAVIALKDLLTLRNKLLVQTRSLETIIKEFKQTNVSPKDVDVLSKLMQPAHQWRICTGVKYRCKHWLCYRRVVSPCSSKQYVIILCGMVGFLTDVTRTPFTSAILALEMTDRHNIIFQLMLAGMVASIISVLVDKHSLYDHLKVQYAGYFAG